jgi:hypothetical protein
LAGTDNKFKHDALESSTQYRNRKFPVTSTLPEDNSFLDSTNADFEEGVSQLGKAAGCCANHMIPLNSPYTSLVAFRQTLQFHSIQPLKQCRRIEIML